MTRKQIDRAVKQAMNGASVKMDGAKVGALISEHVRPPLPSVESMIAAALRRAADELDPPAQRAD